MKDSTTRRLSLVAALTSWLWMPGASLAQPSVEFEHGFDSGIAGWSEHFIQSDTTHLLPSTTDDELPAIPPMNHQVGSPSENPPPDDFFLQANTSAAPKETCAEGNCQANCLGDAGTVTYVLIGPDTYDPAVSGTPDSIDFTAEIKNWAAFQEVHRIDHRISVVIRQDDGPDAYRFFVSEVTYGFVSWSLIDGPLGTWQTVSVSIPDLSQFREFDPPYQENPTPINGPFDLSSPFKIGIGFTQTGTHNRHLSCGGDNHDWVLSPNIGVEDYRVVITTLAQPVPVPAWFGWGLAAALGSTGLLITRRRV